MPTSTPPAVSSEEPSTVDTSSKKPISSQKKKAIIFISVVLSLLVILPILTFVDWNSLFGLADKPEDKDSWIHFYGDQYFKEPDYSENIEENIRIISKERSDTDGTPLWLPMMLEYLKHSPYGMQRGLESFDVLIAHLTHRQELELRIIKEVVGERAVVLPSKKWTKELLKFDTDSV